MRDGRTNATSAARSGPDAGPIVGPRLTAADDVRLMPPIDSPGGTVFAADSRLCLVLEPAGIVRAVTDVRNLEHYDEGSFVGRHFADVCDCRPAGSDRSSVWHARLAAAHAGPAPLQYLDRFSARSRDVCVRTTVTPVPAAGGGLESILLHMHDETGLREVEARLRESESHFRTLAESLPQMVWVADAAGVVTYFSPRWSEFTGRTSDELLDGGYLDLMHPEDRLRLAETIATREGKTPVQDFTCRLRRHDGEYRWVEAHVHVETDEHGRRLMAVGGSTDVTDLRRADEERLISQKRAAIGTLAAGVAHDFNNVISAIVSNAWVAEAELAAGESPADSIQEIGRGARRAGDLVKRLVTFAREEEPQRTPFDLAGVIEEACALVEPSLPAGVALRQRCTADLPMALGDATQLHQVILNLVSNAGYAIGASGGGMIEVSLDLVPGETRTRRPTGAEPGALLRLRVRDNGAGIPSHVLPRVFDPFFTTKPAGHGTGLGLASAQTIIAAHGGTISVDSTVGRGTEFVVHLPTGPRPSERSATVVPPVHADRLAPGDAVPRVLFVDDETALVRLAPRAMAASGCAAVAFTDPVEALTAFQAAPQQFDALVTDLSMPGIDGLQLIDGVLALRPDLPTVLSSGFMTDEQLRAAQELGVGRIVPKPCSVGDLAVAVTELRAAALA